MTKLYHNPAADLGARWELPGQQDRKAARADVPGAPAELAAWLNERRVPAIAAEASGERTEPTAVGERFWELGESTKEPPRYDPKFHDRYGTADFVPVEHSAEIDRLLRRCPKCHGGALAHVLTWIAAEATLEELEHVGHAIKDRCVADKEAIEGGVQ